jgi:hypothetical protein
MFRRTDAHCATWLVRAPTLYDALVTYALNECAGARRCEDGSLEVDDGHGGVTSYGHPLACIEGEEKTVASWGVRELIQAHWDAPIAEVFCSEIPAEVEDHISAARRLLHARLPRSRAKGFVWYLQDGVLATFYRRTARRRGTIEIVGRYLLPLDAAVAPHEWHGSYDEILRSMAVQYPAP